VLDVLLPQRCLLCGAGGTQLCPACRARLPPVAAPLCERCGAPTAWPVRRCRECAGRRLAFATARAAVVYDAQVSRLVAAWKERGLRRLADDAAALVIERLPPPAAVAVTFVPPDPHRALERGYHPARRLAEALAQRWELPCEALLIRVRRSRRQRGLTLADRRRNVRSAFRASTTGGTLLLVDDVYTSGATADAAAAALRRAGAARVDVVTFARAIRSSGLVLERAR
jgi:predicted amidophosphoribosyltransferase